MRTVSTDIAERLSATGREKEAIWGPAFFPNGRAPAPFLWPAKVSWPTVPRLGDQVTFGGDATLHGRGLQPQHPLFWCVAEGFSPVSTPCCHVVYAAFLQSRGGPGPHAFHSLSVSVGVCVGGSCCPGCRNQLLSLRQLRRASTGLLALLGSGGGR